MAKKAEVCAGCGARSGKHPVVAVVATGVLSEESLVASKEEWSAHTVCATCWRDPSNRETPIKGHFFHRGAEGSALDAAGSESIG